ncbi:lysozyme [Methylobacterium sp. Leaf88]|uniref:lysozyme n=1 Tax=Methylobacterium sp. Leaf88 TaxID=1736244 RepID=UPI0009ECA0F8|nr:lysozyme [Methylobacterium sp. Leaf88]
MNLSAIGEAVLIAREGRRLTAYRDSVGIWTIGIGHTAAAGPPLVTPGLRLTAAACDALFRRDVARYVRAVDDAIQDALPDALPDHAFDALVSLCFNIGPSAFARSTVVRRLKAGDRDGAAAAILLWNRPAALIPRRGAEHDQFLTPYDRALPRARRSDAAPVPAPSALTPSLQLPLTPPLPVQRRTVPRIPPLPRRGLEPAPDPAPGRPVALARLWATLRNRLRGGL